MGDRDDDRAALARTTHELRALLDSAETGRLTDDDRRLVQDLIAKLEDLLGQP